MRVIIGQAQREMILKHIRPGSRVLEWGSGGSTLWFADRLPEGATLTSIDHDPKWNGIVRAKVGERQNVRMLIHPPTAPLGANATVGEEMPDVLQAYIHAVDGETFDVILVDGVARTACLQHAPNLLAPGGAVFLHDAQRPWYDAGKACLIEHGTIGSCPDYPGPTLWWGGTQPERAKYSIAAIPLVVCFYTYGTPYEEEVKGLIDSCKRLGLEHDIRAVPPLKSWEHACAHKARFIRDISKQTDRPILWCDADAVIHAPPLLVAGADPDFAVSKAHGWQFNSATVYLNRTLPAQRLMDRWVELCEERPDIFDQIHLDSAWEEVCATQPLRTMWLPQSYAKIFDLPWEDRLVRCGGDTCTATIEQFQASRRFKTQVSQQRPRIMMEPGDALMAARRACRPREVWYDERFVLRPVRPEPAAWGLRTAG